MHTKFTKKIIEPYLKKSKDHVIKKYHPFAASVCPEFFCLMGCLSRKFLHHKSVIVQCLLWSVNDAKKLLSQIQDILLVPLS